jgi:hypothetical protein
VRYRKRPVEIDAIHWAGDDWASVTAFCGEAFWNRASVVGAPWAHEDHEGLVVWNKLEKTWIPVPVGHWIVRGVAGEIYPVAPDVFEQTYEVVPQ